MHYALLKQLGLSDKSVQVYLALLEFGPSSVRKLAGVTDINRTTVYDILKELQERKLVSFFHKETKQKFVAEDPEKLVDLIEQNKKALDRTEKKVKSAIPELQALYHRGGSRPVAKYFSKDNIHKILEDILETCEKSKDKSYRIYSTVGVREFLYTKFSHFSEERVKKKITVKAIAIGEGGELRGLDERKWLHKKQKNPTYILIYPGKTAYVSLDAAGEPVAVLIENDGIFEMQKSVFDTLWECL